MRVLHILKPVRAKHDRNQILMPGALFRRVVTVAGVLAALLACAAEKRAYAIPFAWNENNSFDTWIDLTNWTPLGFPDSPNDQALFGGIITGPQIVELASAVTVNTVDFDNANSYSIQILGGGTLFLNTPIATNNAEVNVFSGDHSFLGAGSVTALRDVDVDIASGSTLTMDQGALLLNTNQLTKLGSGDLRFNQSAAIDNGTVVGQSGTISGIGIVPADLNNLGSTVAPGELNAGALTVQGDFSQSTPGVLSMEILGILPGEQDVLDVQGTVTLGGTLDLQFLSPVSPAPGQVFDLVTARSFTAGAFFNDVTGTFYGTGGFGVYLNTTTNTVQASNCETFGDMDCSGAVDADDVEMFAWAVRDANTYLQRFWFQEFDEPASPPDMADMDGDTLVTFADIAPFVDEVNNAALLGLTVQDVIDLINNPPLIPEPASISYCLLALGFLGGSGRMFRDR